MKILGRIDVASRFEHQHFQPGFRELQCGPSAACARSDYDRIVRFRHDIRPCDAPGDCTRESRVIRVAFVIEIVDHAGSRGIERERILLFDEPVCRISRVGSIAIALRLRHCLHQRERELSYPHRGNPRSSAETSRRAIASDMPA